MADPLGILFLHHHIDDVVRNNLSSILRHNPGATVVTMSAGAPFPGGYALDATPKIKKLHSANPRRSSDWLLCSWFAQRQEKCRKWWIAEWDVHCTTSLRDYYRPVWKFPFVASSVQRPSREMDWRWFAEAKDIPEKFRAHAMGMVPFVFLISDDVLAYICTTMLETPFFAGNGELRFCTVANWCGFPPCAYSPPTDYIVCYIPPRALPKGKGIFHPVKYLVAPRKSLKRLPRVTALNLINRRRLESSTVVAQSLLNVRQRTPL